MSGAWRARLLAALLLLATNGWAFAAGPGYWAGIAEEVCKEITNAETLAGAGKPDEAKGAVLSAYFEVFEEKKMEIAQRAHLGKDRTADVEEMFNNLRKSVGKPGTGNVAAQAEALRQAIRADGKALDTAKIAPDGIAVLK